MNYKLKMKELLVCFVVVYLMVCFKGSTTQSIELEYLSEMCTLPETMIFKATVNTTVVTDNQKSLQLTLKTYVDNVCDMTITSEGCFNGSQQYCTYCIQQEVETYVINFTIWTADFYRFNYYQYYYQMIFFCWLQDSKNLNLESNYIILPLLFTVNNAYQSQLRFEYVYILFNKTSPAVLNKTTINWYHWYPYNTTIIIGDDVVEFNAYDSRSLSLYEVQKEDIAVFLDSCNCSYTCDPVDINESDLNFHYDEESKRVTGSFKIPASQPLIFSGIYLEPSYEYLNWDSQEEMNYTLSFIINEDWSTPLLINLVVLYNTSFCRVDAALRQAAIPKAHIVSDCPSGPSVKNGYIRRGTTATCKCQMVRQSSPAGYVQWFTNDGHSVGSQISSELSVIKITSNTTDLNLSYVCLGISAVGEKSGGTITMQFYEEPSVVNFSVNGSMSVSVNINNSVTFYCQVDGDPPAVAVLTGSGLGKLKVNLSASDVLELTVNDLQCEDSGRYFCIGRNGFEDNDTSSRAYVDVNIACAPKLKNHTEQIPSIQVSPNKDTVFTFEVYGYTEPTGFVLKIETGRSTSAVDKNKYSVTYLPLTPPFGLVTLTIYDANTHGTTTYKLNISSEAGSVEIKFEVVKENPPSPQGINTTSRDIAIGVSVPSIVLVLGTTTAVCVYFRRKGRNMERREDGNHEDNSMYRDRNLIAKNTTPISSNQYLEPLTSFKNNAFDDQTETANQKGASNSNNVYSIVNKSYQYPDEPPPDYPMDYMNI